MTAAHPTPLQRLAYGVIVVALAALLPFACARAQHDAGHAEFHDHYKTWVRPHQPDIRCCDAKYEADGSLRKSGDCYPTQAEPRASELPELKGALVWWAKRDDGKWIEIPESRYVRYENPDPTGRDAQLCEHHERVYGGEELQMIHCFRPPTGGS